MGLKLHRDAVAIDVKDAHVPGVKPAQKCVLCGVKAHAPASKGVTEEETSRFLRARKKASNDFGTTILVAVTLITLLYYLTWTVR